MRAPLKAEQNFPWGPETPLTLDESTRDNLNRLKVSIHQNIYDADFEYGPQSLRWEGFTAGSASITHVPSIGGMRLRLSATVGDVAIRQSRPYHRYQPGKTMFMASAVQFGAAVTGQVQRVGFFDDGNGVFFEQGAPTAANPTGMGVVFRTDTSGTVVSTRIESQDWACADATRLQLNWSSIQMLWIEYAWYGAGVVRWGVFLNGEPIVLHKIAFGNRPSQLLPWARTGNLPVRYEQRNITAAVANDMFHWGVSVIAEGRIDDQRGFTYSYGMSSSTLLRPVSGGTRFPILSFRGRQMANVQESNTATGGSTTTLIRTGAGWTVNQWAGLYLFTTGGAGAGQVARILSNTTDTLALENNILPGSALGVALASGTTYQIGLINRGQLLPRQLFVQSSAVCLVEVLVSIPGSPVSLTAPTFTPLASLGSPSSFAERDVSATGTATGGEVVFAFVSPNNQLQQIDLSNLFPLFNTIRGGNTDIMTVCVSGTANVGAYFVCQEAMS